MLLTAALFGFNGVMLFLTQQAPPPGAAGSDEATGAPPPATEAEQIARIDANEPSASAAEEPVGTDWMAIPKPLLPPRPEGVATVPMAPYVATFHQPTHEFTGTVTTITEHDIRPGKPGKVSHLHPDFRVGGYVVEGETLFSIDGLPHHAPVDGVLRSVDLELGETVNKGQRGCRLASLEDLEIRAPYPSALAKLVTSRHPTVAIDVAEAEFLGHVIGVTNGAIRVSLSRPHHQADVRPDHLFKESATLFIRSPVQQAPQPAQPAVKSAEKKNAEANSNEDKPASNSNGT